MQHNGLCIRDFDSLKPGKKLLVFIGAVCSRCTLECVFHRFGGERLTVLKAHTFAQVERPDLLVSRRLPMCCQQRLHRAIWLNFGQGLEYVVEHHFGNGRSRPHRGIQPRRLQHHTQNELILVFICLFLLTTRNCRQCSDCDGPSACMYKKFFASNEKHGLPF